MTDMNINAIAGQLTTPADRCAIFSRGCREGFWKFSQGAVSEVNQLHHEANQAVEALTAGRSQDVHNTMIALQKADVSFQLLMQIRNKVVSAYETVMRMQI
jgi:flagellar hook-basal body complex protein FliE